VKRCECRVWDKTPGPCPDDLCPYDRTVANLKRSQREHELSSNCWCHPVQDTKEPTLWIHNYIH
jgi:hypothetical protein